MRLYLTPEKVRHVKNACQRVLLYPFPLIREVAQVSGLLTSSFQVLFMDHCFIDGLKWIKQGHFKKISGILTNL